VGGGGGGVHSGIGRAVWVVRGEWVGGPLLSFRLSVNAACEKRAVELRMSRAALGSGLSLSGLDPSGGIHSASSQTRLPLCSWGFPGGPRFWSFSAAYGQWSFADWSVQSLPSRGRCPGLPCTFRSPILGGLKQNLGSAPAWLAYLALSYPLSG